MDRMTSKKTLGKICTITTGRSEIRKQSPAFACHVQGSGSMNSKGHRSAISDLSLSAPCPSQLTSAVGPIVGCSCFSRPFDLDIAFGGVVSQQASIASYHTA